MHPAVSLSVAAVCLAGSVFFYRHRDGVLRFMTRVRGYADGPTPGPRRRYQRSGVAGIDMFAPSVALLLLAGVFGVCGVLASR